jgi:hypothetical protein
VANGKNSSDNSLDKKMKASLGRIQESKRAFRQKLANAPIAQKLRMLDQLRLRTIAIKKAAKDYRKTLRKLA